MAIEENIQINNIAYILLYEYIALLLSCHGLPFQLRHPRSGGQEVCVPSHSLSIGIDSTNCPIVLYGPYSQVEYRSEGDSFGTYVVKRILKDFFLNEILRR